MTNLPPPAERLEALPKEVSSVLLEESRNLARALLAAAKVNQPPQSRRRIVRDAQAQEYLGRFIQAHGETSPDEMLTYLLDTAVLSMQERKLWRFGPLAPAGWPTADEIGVMLYTDADNHHAFVRRFGMGRKAPHAIALVPL